MRSLLTTLALLLTVAFVAKGETAILASFEKDDEGVRANGKVVEEHATDGKKAMKVESDEKETRGLFIDDGATLRKFKGMAKLQVDVFNPQDKAVTITLRVDDSKSKDYNSRHNNDAVKVEPGKSTLEFDLTKLARSGAGDKSDFVDIGDARLVLLFMTERKEKETLFFDNLRLASADGKETPKEQPKEQPKESPQPTPVPAAAAELDPMAKEVIASWEDGEDSKVDAKGQVIEEHATAGKKALRLESQGENWGQIAITDKATLAKLQKFQVLKFDVFNPQDEPVTLGIRVDDAKSVSYGTRYNDDGVVARPGKSTIELNLTGLTKSNARNFDQRDRVDMATVKLVNIFLFGVAKPRVLFVDNLRLEGSGLPKVAGLRAFDFGPAGSIVYPGFEGCTNKMLYTDERGFGWTSAENASVWWIPDGLGSDGVAGSEFKVKLPDGKYELNFVMDGWGLYHWLPYFSWRKVALNGQEVIDEKVTGEEFFDKRYLAHEDEEDLPGQDLWKKFIEPRQKVYRFDAEVKDGLLKVDLKSDQPWGRMLVFLVAYPEAQKDQGRKWMEALEAKRHAAFNELVVVTAPKPTGEEPKPTEAQTKTGFIAFNGHPEEDLAFNARPTAAAEKIAMEGAAGERVNAVLGLYPLKDLPDVTVHVSSLQGPGGKQIHAQAIQLRKVRNYLKRGGGMMGTIRPYILQDLRQEAKEDLAVGQTPTRVLDMAPRVTRGLWLTLMVPQGTAAGVYTGKLTIRADGQGLELPVELKVFPFTLDKVTDITVSVTGATAGHWRGWFPEYEAKWWAMADVAMKNMADHGMNAVTGGPGARLKGIKDGKADIDYKDLDKWLELAAKHGLTMPGDGYQGLDIVGIPGDNSKDQVANNEAAAQKQYGVSYEELIRIAYGDIDRHVKEKGWPARSFSFVDEPRTEYSNVEPTIQTVGKRVKASPGTLFSGYYSTGGGREPLYELMPISICHVDRDGLGLVKKAGKKIWEYNGSRERDNIGRWCFVAVQAGMGGFLRNGYEYVNSQPYWDFSDDEGSWSVVYPSHNGLADSVGWERTSDGANDYRYLTMCKKLIEKAKAAGKGATEAAAAQKYMDETLRGVDLEKRESAVLTPAQYDEFKRALAEHIAKLTKALE